MCALLSDNIHILILLNVVSLNGTVAVANRFHDDPNTYTGVHKAGGPTTIDHDKQGLDQLLDRSSADVRGVKKVVHVN